MEQRNKSDKGGLIVVGVIAFALGRWSVSSPTDHPISQPTSAVPMPSSSAGAETSPTTEPSPVEPTALVSPVVEPEAPTDTVYFARCADARAAGAAPIHEGEPGYAPHLDRDGDGVACE